MVRFSVLVAPVDVVDVAPAKISVPMNEKLVETTLDAYLKKLEKVGWLDAVSPDERERIEHVVTGAFGPHNNPWRSSPTRSSMRRFARGSSPSTARRESRSAASDGLTDAVKPRIAE